MRRALCEPQRVARKAEDAFNAMQAYRKSATAGIDLQDSGGRIFFSSKFVAGKSKSIPSAARTIPTN